MNAKSTAMLAIALAATALYASIIRPPYDKSRPPGMALPDAYAKAAAALGTDTNRFHCVSALINTEFPEDGWHFIFYSTNSKAAPKLIMVEFGGKVIFDNGAR